MNTYFIFKGKQYGILQTDDSIEEVIIRYDFDVRVQSWVDVAEIRYHAQRNNMEYVGHDAFYK